jgi:vacuolar-type H+-ATPase subunit I/STV1
MKTATIAIVLLAALSAGLTGVTVATVSRNRELAKRLEQPQASAPVSNNDRLRQLLEEKELAYIQLQDEYRQYQRERAGTNAPAIAPSAAAASTNAPIPYMERLRQNDPERYRQMIEQREQRRKQMDEWYRDQLAKLDERAQSAQSQQEAELANQIADTLAKLNELRDQWRALRDMPEDQRREAADQLQAQTRDAYRTLNELRELDRQVQLGNLARSIGYTDADAIQAFVDNITGIYQNTRYTIGRGGGGGGGGGNGGGGPPLPQ